MITKYSKALTASIMILAVQFWSVAYAQSTLEKVRTIEKVQPYCPSAAALLSSRPMSNKRFQNLGLCLQNHSYDFQILLGSYELQSLVEIYSAHGNLIIASHTN